MSRLLLKWTRTLAERTRGRYDDRGAGFVEYAGMLLLIATIVIAVMGLDLDTDIGNFIQNQVNEVFGADD
jgi:Flp pilus assembly pilin Flp